MSDLVQSLRLAGAASSWKNACRVAATDALVLAGVHLVDGIELEAGDRVLLTAQDSAIEHGIWVVSTGVWSRAEDWGVDAFAKLGTTVMVLEGAGAGLWTLSEPTSGRIIIGETATEWVHTPELDHGALGGGTLHAAATTASAGFMSAAHYDLVAEATPSLVFDSIVRRDSTGQAAVTRLYCSALESQGVTNLQINGAPCAVEDIGFDTWRNVLFRGGIGGSALNGECGSLNWMYGDTRAGIPEVLCFEINYVCVAGYDPDPISGLSRTPYVARIHSGRNTNTLAGVGLAVQAVRELTIESEEAYVQTSVRAGHYIADALEVKVGGVAAQGFYAKDYAFGGRTYGTSTVAIDLGALVPATQLASCEIEIIGRSTDFTTYEAFKIRFRWLGGAPAATISDLNAIGGWPAIAGRVAVAVQALTPVVTITGVNGKTIDWTMRASVKVQSGTAAAVKALTTLSGGSFDHAYYANSPSFALAGSDLATWTDDIGASDFTASGNRPELITNDGDGDPAVSFVLGSSERMEHGAALVTPNADFTIVLVYKYIAGFLIYSQGNVASAAGTNQIRIYGSASGQLNVDTYDGASVADVVAPQAADNAWHRAIIRYRASDKRLECSIDGATSGAGLAAVTRSGGTVTTTRSSLGSAWTSTGHAAFGTSKLRVFATVQRRISDAEALDVDNLLRGAWRV